MKNRKILSYVLTSFAAILVAACNGGDTSGGKQDFAGTDFVGDGSTTGRISVSLSADTISTGSTGEFLAVANDSRGTPIRDIPIVCDSEEGLAVVEPSRGRAITSSRGGISGVVGCTRPGSFRFGCRLGSAGGIREFVTVQCDGAVPLGFTGFPGAAGGGLGGGVADDSGPVRITSISVVSSQAGGSSAGFGTIDVSRCSCNNDTPNDSSDDKDEFFADDRLRVTVVNTTPSSFTVTGVRYLVTSGAGNREISSYVINYAAEIPSGGNEVLDVLFLKAGPGGKLYFNAASTVVPILNTFRNVTVIVSGIDGSGQPVEIRGATGVSFGDYDLCTAGQCG